MSDNTLLGVGRSRVGSAAVGPVACLLRAAPKTAADNSRSAARGVQQQRLHHDSAEFPRGSASAVIVSSAHGFQSVVGCAVWCGVCNVWEMQLVAPVWEEAAAAVAARVHLQCAPATRAQAAALAASATTDEDTMAARPVPLLCGIGDKLVGEVGLRERL